MDDFRKRADELLAKTEDRAENLTLEEVKALVHDLRVHQVELELQNEELRRIQDKLQKATDKYARLYNNAPAGYLTLDENGGILQANQTFGEMIAVDTHSLVQGSFFDLLHPEDRSGFIARFRAFYNHPKGKNIEIRLIRGNGGGYFHAALEGRADRNRSFDEDAERSGDHLLAVVSDQSHKVDTERRLRKQKALLQTILDGITDIIALQMPDHTIIAYNQAGYDFLNLSPQEAEGRKCYELLGRVMQCDDCATSVSIRSGRPETVEKFIPELGRWFQVRAIPVFDNGDRLAMVVEQLHDIDDRKKAEIALVENEKRYRTLVENSLQGVVVSREDPARVMFANHRMFDIIGYTPEELTALTSDQIFELIHPDDRDDFFTGFQQSSAGLDESRRRAYRIIHKNGLVKWVEVFSAQINYGGQPAAQTVLLDVTERKIAEEEQHKLEQDLRQAQKMEAVGTLAGGIAHDFNNLLQAINGYAQIMLMDQDPERQEYKNLKAILDAGDRAAQLVRQMLLFSRKIEADRRPVDINHEIELARKLLERAIPKMVRIEMNPGENLWSVMADPIQLEQVLLNLGSNAADAMPDGGRLVIDTRNITIDEHRPQELFGLVPGRYVLVTVSDTGCGMSDEELERIFEPFYTTKEVGKGTGLGLASVYGIVKSHGGFIHCYSEVGQGTVFKIYFPALSESADQPDKDKASKIPIGGTETILLVDDEAAVRNFAGTLLAKFGYRVLYASSGEEALDRYDGRRNQIDLVILDISMPGMGGHKCLREILKLDPSAKIVVSSGYSINGPLKETLRSGAAGFVGKPYQMNEMLKTIRRILDDR